MNGISQPTTSTTQASAFHGWTKKRRTKKRVSTGTLPYQMVRYWDQKKYIHMMDSANCSLAVQDVAKLQFALSIVWMYFFWSQYIVIWYGNVPVETRFFIQRVFVQPWTTLAWVVLVVGWLIPFAYLLKRLTGRPPQRHAPLVVVAVLGLVGIFLERVFLVFPAVSSTARLPLTLRDLAITAGFLSLFVLSRRWFFAYFKPVLNLPHTGH